MIILSAPVEGNNPLVEKPFLTTGLQAAINRAKAA
jgi:hypothetical protein